MRNEIHMIKFCLIVPSYTDKNIARLLPLALLLMLCTRTNRRLKLMIFSGIALYYGDTYIRPLLVMHIDMHHTVSQIHIPSFKQIT